MPDYIIFMIGLRHENHVRKVCTNTLPYENNRYEVDSYLSETGKKLYIPTRKTLCFTKCTHELRPSTSVLRATRYALRNPVRFTREMFEIWEE